MTTIIPTPEEAEGKKLLGYQPGERVTLTFTVESNDGSQLVGTDEVCVLADESGEGEEAPYEGEATERALPPKGTPPKALLIVGGKPPAR